MAINLEQKISIDLGAVVSNAITAVKAVRRSEQARKEAEFQKAVAAGMSYKDQIKFREKQLEDEKGSGLFDSDYVSDLEVAIAETKKLARFETMRAKYKKSLDDYVGGKTSISQYIGVLNDILDGEQDPEKRQEVMDLLSSARKEKGDIEINAIKNRSLLAQKDTSISLIDKSISEVKSKRALSSINENDDETAMWDDTLLALQGAKSKLMIENGLNEITYQQNRSNLKSNDKLGLYNNFISEADASSPVTYDGVTYPSLKAYWENKRGDYISNEYFNDIKEELTSQTNVIAATNEYGQIPIPRIQAVSDFYNTLRSKPEFAPYADKIEQQRLESVTGMANELYTSLVDEANVTEDFSKAESAISSVENRLGIKIARPAFEKETAKGKTIAEKVIKETTPPANPSAPLIPPKETPTAPTEKTTITEPAPAASPKPESKPVAPLADEIPPVTPNPTIPSAAPSGYTGVSIVDYLKSVNKDSSFASRAKLAAEKGITNYTGAGKQNDELLKLLRG